MFTKEVLGTNVPKSLMTRSNHERVDVASDQFGGTITFFGSGLALHYGLDALYKAVNPNVLKQPHANQWRIAGKSTAIFAVQTALYWAIPFLRDYITAKRTGKESFTHVIGAEADHPGVGKDDQPSAGVAEKIKYYKCMFWKATGIGVAVAAAAVGLTALAVAKNRAFKNTGLTKWLMNNMALGEGKLTKYPRWSQFFFVALASYAGRFHAVRDHYELKEQLLHFGSFLFGWFIPPMLFERFYGKQINKMIQNKALLQKVTEGKTSLDFSLIKKHLAKEHPELFQKAQRLFAKQQIFGLAFSIVVLSLLPPLINFKLTEDRLARAKKEQELLTPVQAPHASVDSALSANTAVSVSAQAVQEPVNLFVPAAIPISAPPPQSVSRVVNASTPFQRVWGTPTAHPTGGSSEAIHPLRQAVYWRRQDALRQQHLPPGVFADNGTPWWRQSSPVQGNAKPSRLS